MESTIEKPVMVGQTKKKYKSVGIRPKFKFENEGSFLEGSFVGKETIQNPHAKKESDKEFTVWIIADEIGREWTVSGGHINYLFNKAGLKGGEGVRVTFTGWDELEDGNKCRTYSLEIEQA